MHYRRLWLTFGIIYIITIFLLSLVKVPDISSPISHSDKIIHFLMYFILVGWFVQLYENRQIRLFVLLCAIFLGLFIELLQGMTSYRNFDYYDGIANSIGAIAAFSLAKTSFSCILSEVDIWIVAKLNKIT